MYFDDPVDNSPIVASADMRMVLSVNGLIVVVMGILPGSLMTACVNAISNTLKY
jgi:NADH-quinone oxidoreductase subunit N